MLQSKYKSLAVRFIAGVLILALIPGQEHSRPALITALLYIAGIYGLVLTIGALLELARLIYIDRARRPH